MVSLNVIEKNETNYLESIKSLQFIDLNNFEASNLVPEINNHSKIEQDIIKNQEILLYFQVIKQLKKYLQVQNKSNLNQKSVLLQVYQLNIWIL